MSEWDHRQLCSDGACVGVIGSDGTCKVCGRAAPNWGDERKRGLIDQPDEDEDDEDEDGDYEVEDEGERAPEDQGPLSMSDPEASQAWDDRKLCPDDACIGVIGDDGTCKVCKRSAA
jgi:hypothetical protein